MTQIDEKALDVAVESLRPLFREPISYLEEAARDSIAAYIAALPLGDGWVLVPKQITDEMAQAFFDARDDYERLKANKVFPRPTQADYIYRAMIAASPAKGARDE